MSFLLKIKDGLKDIYDPFKQLNNKLKREDEVFYYTSTSILFN